MLKDEDENLKGIHKAKFKFDFLYHTECSNIYKKMLSAVVVFTVVLSVVCHKDNGSISSRCIREYNIPSL